MRSDGRETASVRRLAAGAIVALALGVGACASQHADAHAAPVGEGVLVAGAHDLATASFGAERELDRVVSDSGPGTSERAIGSSLTTMRPTQYHGHAALLLTKTSRRGTAEFVDTALVLRAGLVPVWEVASNSRGWHGRFDFDGPTVHVDAASPDSTHRATHTYPYPVFSFNELDEIVRAVPLRDGYHTIVALYSEGDDALETDTISVSAPRDGTVWNVRFADPVIISHYMVDSVTRRVTALEVTYHKWPMRLRFLPDSTARGSI